MNRERAKELLPIFQAYAEGKDIEYKPKADNEWKEADLPGFYNDIDYRIKPEVPYIVPRHIKGFRALRDGEEWFLGKHTWVKDDLPKGFRPLLQSEIDFNIHDDIQYLSPYHTSSWKGPSWVLADNDSGTFRTNRPLPAVKIKKKVPLEARDILPGSVIKKIEHDEVCFDSITQVNLTRVVAGGKEITYHRMWNDFRIHHPSYGYENGLPVWKPCYKEIEVEES